MRVCFIPRGPDIASVSSQESPMESRELIQHLPERAPFRPDAMTKIDCFRSDRLFAGLNCFEPGQTQSVHTHGGAEKFYVVLTGKATFIVGTQRVHARAGGLIPAPAGVPHGVASGSERSVSLIGRAPPP